MLEVPVRTPSGNQLSGYHWRKRHRMKRDWHLLILAAMRQAGASEPTGCVDVIVERHAARSLDADNAVAGCKVVLDAMVAAGLLVDDRAKYVRSVVVRQIKTPAKAERSVIRLRPVGP